MLIERGEIYFVNLNPVQVENKRVTDLFWFYPSIRSINFLLSLL